MSTSTSADEGARTSKDLAEEARRVVTTRVEDLQRRYIDSRAKGSSEAVATLARLRRGAGKEPDALPELWPVTLAGLTPPQWDEAPPTYLERAVHTALTLYAVHQQSRSSTMHVHGTDLGAAVGRLAGATSEAPVRRRFEALGTAESFLEAAHHARGLVTQLRAAELPLDYGRFARQLYYLQLGGDAARRVRLQWGRAYHATAKNQQSAEDNEQTNDFEEENDQ